MKAITICQPYAHLIVIGEKRVENRSWATSYRGPVVIHAGKSRSWLSGATDASLIERFGELPAFGAIVGVGRISGCYHINDINAGKYDRLLPWLRDHEHTEGDWCWMLEGVRRAVEPRPYLGRQGFFQIPGTELASMAFGPIIQHEIARATA